MRNKKILSISFIRMFAMLCVVLVHVSGTYYSTLPAGGDAFQKYHFLNRIVRIEASLFIFMTGLVFFYRYYAQEMTKSLLKRFYKKRVTYILVPYLVWAVFYEGYAVFTGFRSFEPAEAIIRILEGDSYYQLHFIFLIVQFYLILPLIVWGSQKLDWFRKYMWVFGIVLDLAFFMLRISVDWVTYPVFLSMIGPFLLGGWVGIHYSQEKERSTSKWTFPLGALALIVGAIAVRVHYHLYIANTWYVSPWLEKLPNFFYMMVGAYIVFRIAERLSERLSQRKLRFVEHVASYSFGFYLIHPFVLKEVARWVPVHSNYLFHVDVVLRYTLTVAFCYLIIRAFHQFVPFAQIVFGKLPPLQKKSKDENMSSTSVSS
ncbi:MULTISPECIES: acyltransferase [Pontibacillus]|uniref:Acyltransferase n=1 Tax=Pontibacillus chungwhensis TaxID=265426 RepID=A0ABY8UVI7_9BACI|nr:MULTISPECIES: acyltransferase [Pontibacillus]MCD5324261.1 acyltransferase [Pontibacillus sp. HN14]WIF97686.1 acyltransferase [Pontibacillus chungwhensis]